MMMMDDDKTPQDISPAIMDAEITGEISQSQHERWRCLVLDVELRSQQEDPHGSSFPGSVSRRFNFSPMPSPRIGPSSSSRRRTNLINVFNLRNRNNNNNNNAADIEEGAALVSNISRTWSLTNLLTLRKSNKTESLPVTPLVHSNPESMHGSSYAVDDDDQASMVREHTLPIRRTRSVPTLIDKDGNVKQSGLLRVIPTPSRESKLNCDGGGGEDVPEEEAVCRICMVELGEDSEAFKMECMCKGELALSHKACTIKWFSIKGNITCDVCKQVVKNLPVTLLRVEDSSSQDRSSSRRALNEWHDVPVLVIVSMLAYFCFLEQLLVMEMKSSAVAVALPFSCIVGLLASVISTTMVKRSYVWIFATVQFGLVVLFGHVFYSVVKQPVVCIVLATMIGFGLTMSGTTAINEFFKRRRSLHAHHQPASTQVAPPQSQTAE